MENLMFQTNGCRKWKKLLSWQNILNRIHIATDIKEKLTNQGDVHHGEVIHIYLSLWNIWKPCHGTINIWPHNLRTALEKYSRFHWNCKQLRVGARNSTSNCEIYFTIFSETIHITLKIFLQHGFRKCG